MKDEIDGKSMMYDTGLHIVIVILNLETHEPDYHLYHRVPLEAIMKTFCSKKSVV